MKQLKTLLPVLLLVSLALTACSGKSDEESLTEGRAYLESLEEGSVEEVQSELREQHRARLAEEGEELFAQLEADPDSVWEAFDDYVIVGDSRAQGFQKWLPNERVLADLGDTILTIESHYDEIRTLNPASVFCSYGINDISCGLWDTPETYADEYRGVLESLAEVVPDANLFVVSTLPAADPAFSSFPSLRNIPEYNAALEEMCADMDGVYYIDCSNVMDGHTDWYREDGIHLLMEAYPGWGIDLLRAAYDAETEDTVNSEFTE